MVMTDCAARAAQHQEPGPVTFGARLLSYELFRQVVIKLAYLKFFNHSSKPFLCCATVFSGPTTLMK